MNDYVAVGDSPPLVKQGTCKQCKVPLFGYSFQRRYLCGDCSKKMDNKGLQARKINDYVVKAPNLSAERKSLILQNQIDRLKRENNLLKEHIKRLKNANKT